MLVEDEGLEYWEGVLHEEEDYEEWVSRLHQVIGWVLDGHTHLHMDEGVDDCEVCGRGRPVGVRLWCGRLLRACRGCFSYRGDARFRRDLDLALEGYFEGVARLLVEEVFGGGG